MPKVSGSKVSSLVIAPKLLDDDENKAVMRLLDARQAAYVYARLIASHREACEIARISEVAVDRWPPALRQDIENVIYTAQQRPIMAIRARLEQAGHLATAVLVDEMERGRLGARNRVDAAKTVLDRIGVVAQSDLNVRVVGKGYVNVSPDQWPALDGAATELPSLAASSDVAQDDDDGDEEIVTFDCEDDSDDDEST